MKAIMIHAITDGSPEYPPIPGAITVDELEKICKVVDRARTKLRNAEPPTERGVFPCSFVTKFLADFDDWDFGKYLLTFDDALACQRLAFPLLKKYDLRAAFFMPTITPLSLYKDKSIMLAMGMDNFLKTYFDKLLSEQHLGNTAMDFYPDDFLQEFDFYSENEKKYRYFRNNFQQKHHLIIDEMLRDFATNDKVRRGDKEKLMKSTYMAAYNGQLSVEEVAKEDHIIGLHSTIHFKNIDELTPSELLDDYGVNLQVIKEHYKSEITMASHPLGQYNEVSCRVLRMLGITTMFDSKENDYEDWRALPRMDVKDFMKQNNII